jgi:hypothetical protein
MGLSFCSHVNSVVVLGSTPPKLPPVPLNDGELDGSIGSMGNCGESLASTGFCGAEDALGMATLGEDVAAGGCAGGIPPPPSSDSEASALHVSKSNPDLANPFNVSQQFSRAVTVLEPHLVTQSSVTPY